MDERTLELSEALFTHLSEGRTALAERSRHQGRELTSEDEEMWAESAANKFLKDRQTAGYANGDPLTEGQIKEARVDAWDRSFKLGRAIRWWNNESMAINAWIIGGRDVRVQYQNGQIRTAPAVAKDSADLERQINRLIGVGGVADAEWDQTRHEVGFVMPDGTRVMALHAVGEEVFLTLRRPTMIRTSLDELTRNGTMSPLQASFLASLPKAHQQLFIGGPTNAGKTTLLRAVIGGQPKDWMVFTVETEPELLLERHPDLYPITYSMQGTKETTQGNFSRPLGDLIRSCQRASADLVVVGEVRDGSEAGAALLALNQGYAVMGTIHSKSPIDGVSNLARYFSEGTGSPLDAAMQRAGRGVDWFVQMRRLPNGKVVISEIGFVELAGDGRTTVTPIWAPDDDRAGRLNTLAAIPGPILEDLKRHGFNSELSDEVMVHA